MRVDKWLWHARFFKTRSKASAVVAAGHLRVNGQHARKAAQAIRAGDVLTFPQAKTVRIIKILALADRRGPAPEAQALYEDLTPQAPRDDSAPRPVQGRPDSRDRRAARAAKQARLE
ncbi:RNA-binding S4 domain-containing protein [Meridianimarinicoccus sp. MJW13]|uniref:RNA-binding S4 domain-containing protein n=1 Tax=Meridianimarinicoccus sp. MJW13 TaxID=2720031 RepID=UPI0018682951|nr:RNA-binding S4 domain-containing protein [Fluviibacterium sp. MJW13]